MSNLEEVSPPGETGKLSPQRRGVIAGLIVSHLVIFLVFAFIGVVHSRNELFSAAEPHTPLQRLALRFEDVPPALVARYPALDQELQAVDVSLGPPAADVLRLMFRLHERDWQKAEEICTGLSWPKCDRLTLSDMRKVVSP
jgi:hypothetical protein